MKKQYDVKGIVMLTEESAAKMAGTAMWNEDLRPTTAKEHFWTTYNYAALWVGMCICIPTYMMAAGMISIGMNWSQAIITILLGNAIVLIPILLNAHAGCKFGIPYPVFARLWFGSKGAHIPALARAIVAAGWFGINTWIGTGAIDTLLGAFMKSWAAVPFHTAIVFVLFWLLNVSIAYRGPQAIRKLTALAGPTLAVSALILMGWAYTRAGGWGPILAQPSKFATTGDFMKIFFPALTGVIAFWATLALNIPDFCRYAKTQKAQFVGQTIALPITMAAFSFIGIAVTSATVVIFGEALWDPVALMAKFPPIIVLIGTCVIVLSSVTLNVSANVVAPARAIENLWPRKITFGIGAIITGLFAIAMCPWYLMSNFGNYIFGWLGTYAALLGPIDGIAVSDYWLARHRRMDLEELYVEGGRYSYSSGFNMNGVYALVIGILASVLGLIFPSLRFLWDNAWAVGLVVSMIVYYLLMRNNKTLLTKEEYNAITDFRQEKDASKKKPA